MVSPNMKEILLHNTEITVLVSDFRKISLVHDA